MAMEKEIVWTMEKTANAHYEMISAPRLDRMTVNQQ